MKDSSGLGPRTRMSHAYGKLIEARSFLQRRWEPSDEKTRADLLKFAKALGVLPVKPMGQRKMVRCLSDLCVALKGSKDGLIAWPTGSDDMSGPPYGRNIAIQLIEALKSKDYLVLHQKSSKRDKLARIYKVDRSILRSDYKFKMHFDCWLVEVRSEKKREKGRVIGGHPVSRKSFIGQIEPLEAEMRRINDTMKVNPLMIGDEQFVGCKRVFNDGSLQVGGRSYGGWQNFGEAERLTATINGDQVCEIDVKACFLAIAYARFGGSAKLKPDPYMAVKFVGECNDKLRQKELRNVCKKLVATYLCKKKDPIKGNDLLQFPKGEVCKATGKLISFKKEYDLNHSVDYYMKQIKDAFPFLEQQKECGDNLMFQESNVIVKAMLKLVDLKIPSYPVHDCLIVRLNDKDKAVLALTEAMEEVLGYVPSMDVSYLNKYGEVECEIIQQTSLESQKEEVASEISQVEVMDDDYGLIEG